MVFVILAHGFEDIEAISVVDILRRADMDVKMVSVDGELSVTSAHGITIHADMLIEDVKKEDVELIVLPGGMPCTENFIGCTILGDLIKTSYADGKLIAAISSAPWVLAHLGLLAGKRVVSHPDFKDKLTDAEILPEIVVHDGQFITSQGSGTALHFAYKIVEVLKNKTASDKLKDEMLVPLFF